MVPQVAVHLVEEISREVLAHLVVLVAAREVLVVHQVLVHLVEEINPEVLVLALLVVLVVPQEED